MVKDDIRITVKAEFLAQHSNSAKHRFAFAYTITIANYGQRSAQLLSRSWKIKDANNKIQVVEGLGVVGEQPRIAPGGAYTYTSSAIIETEIGTMEGYYLMQCEDGDTFQAAIPTFVLAPAHAIH